MTLVEFLAPLRTAPHKVRLLALLYWEETKNGPGCLTTSRIREILVSIRYKGAKKLNVSDCLAKAGELVDREEASRGRSCWRLTDSGRRVVEARLNLPSGVLQSATDVRLVLEQIQDEAAHRFVEEAIRCLEAGALRAAVVFLWSGAVQKLRHDCFVRGCSSVNAELKRHNKKARALRRVEDFAFVKDSELLQIAQGLGVLDKSQKQVLTACLDLRNSCGHPSSYWPGEQKVRAFIEDLVGIVWL